MRLSSPGSRVRLCDPESRNSYEDNCFSPETANTQTASNLPWLSPQLPGDLGLVNYNIVLTVMGQKGTLNLKWVWTQSSVPGGEMCFYACVCVMSQEQ